MKKQIKVGETNYTIEVTLNALVEKRIGGKKQHRVTATNDVDESVEEVYITEMPQLHLIEESLTCKKKHPKSQEELDLMKLGYE